MRPVGQTLQPTPLTWLATLIGPRTWARIDIDGPVRLPELRHLIANLKMAEGWLLDEVIEDCRHLRTPSGKCTECDDETETQGPDE